MNPQAARLSGNRALTIILSSCVALMVACGGSGSEAVEGAANNLNASEEPAADLAANPAEDPALVATVSDENEPAINSGVCQPDPPDTHGESNDELKLDTPCMTCCVDQSPEVKPLLAAKVSCEATCQTAECLGACQETFDEACASKSGTCDRFEACGVSCIQ